MSPATILHKISHPKIPLTASLVALSIVIITAYYGAIDISTFATYVTLLFVAVNFITSYSSSQTNTFVTLLSNQSRIYDILHRQEEISTSQQEEISNYFESLGYMAKQWKIDGEDAVNLFGKQAITVFNKFGLSKTPTKYENFTWFVERSKVRKEQNSQLKLKNQVILFITLVALIVGFYLIYRFFRPYDEQYQYLGEYLGAITAGISATVAFLIYNKIFKDDFKKAGLL